MEPTVPNNETSKSESTEPTTPSPETTAPVAPSEPTPSAPAATGQPATVVGGADQAQTVTTLQPSAAPSGKKKWLLPVVIAVAVVLLAGGYVFGMYLPNRPDAVYSKSLSNTGKAVDSLVDYTNSFTAKNYKSYALDGTMKVKSGEGSFDGTLKGSFDTSANANLTVDVDALGQKIGAEVRSLRVNGNTSPDVYLKVSGIKSMLDSFGASSLDSLDGQWIAVDHTLIDTYASSFKQQLASSSSSLPTSAQVHDALVKVQTVNKDYLFTGNSSKAVLKQDKYVGKETKDGRSTYHYKVSFNKDHAKAYGDALKNALDSSSLNDWYKKQNNGKNISSSLDSSAIEDSTNTADTLDVWVDTKTKLVHAVQFNDSKDPNSVATISQNYTGGDDYPFGLSVTDKSGGTTTKMNLSLSINKKTNVSKVDVTGSEDTTDYSLNFTVTPSNNAVNVIAPTGAQPVMNVLSKLGLSSSL